MNMLNINFNQEKNGIEIRFDTKPSEEMLSNLKLNGFRWSGKQKMWYAKQNDQRMDFVNSIGDTSEVKPSAAKERKKTEDTYSLWDMTRTDDIENNFEKFHIYNTKDIAAIIRKHIRERFKMCKWSVRSDTNSIDVDLLASPWEKDSEEVKAIVHYVYKFAQSYNYDNSDSMTDYFDVNFYGVYESGIVSWKYAQTESNDEYRKMSEDFSERNRQFKKAEDERREKEIQEYLKQREIEEAESKKMEKIRSENHDIIESSSIVKDVDSYYIIDCYEPEDRKLDDIREYQGRMETVVAERRGRCEVTREVYMSKEVYDLFSKQLMDEYTFLDGMGGSRTVDPRVNSMIDFNYMTPEERDSVEWFNCNTVAIFCDNELMMVIDPQGYSYARYVYFIDDKSVIDREYTEPEKIIDKKMIADKEKAKILEDMSTEIIMRNDFDKEWNMSKSSEYREKVKEWMNNNDYRLTKDIIRQITIDNLKSEMYKLYFEINSIQSQFEYAFNNGYLESGRRVTIVYMDGWCGLSIIYAYYIKHENCSYAQYDKAVRITYKRNAKRKEETRTICNEEVVVYDGWYEIPEELFWNCSEQNGVVTKMSKYTCFDKQMLDDVLGHLKAKNALPIINTYKPDIRS